MKSYIFLGILCILLALIKAQEEESEVTILDYNVPPSSPIRFGKETYIAQIIPAEIEENQNEGSERAASEEPVDINQEEIELDIQENEAIKEEEEEEENENEEMSQNFIAVGSTFGNMAALVPANLSFMQTANINRKRLIGYIPVASPNGAAFVLPAGGVRLVHPEQSVDLSGADGNSGEVTKKKRNKKKKKKKSNLGRHNKNYARRNQYRRNNYNYNNYNYNLYDMYRRGYMPVPYPSYYYSSRRPPVTSTGKRQKGSHRRRYSSRYALYNY